MKELEFTKGFVGDALGPISVDDAVRRVVAFGCSSRSGFLGYDLTGHVARESGQLNCVCPWTILLADALGGRVTVQDVQGFTQRINRFSELLNLVPDADLASMRSEDLDSVIYFCTFGFPGAWAPKITKVGALFKPRAIPVLDGYLALAFGYQRDRFSAGREPRWRAIERVVKAIAAGIERQVVLLDEVRHRAEEIVPAMSLLSDVRLADVIIWTSQDDRLERPGKPRNVWLQPPTERPPSVGDVVWLHQQVDQAEDPDS